MGTVAYTYDKEGNVLSEKSLQKSAIYEYTDTNRMKTSIGTDMSEKTRTTSYYGYDAFGRHTLVKDEGGDAMRTLYDGLSFDKIRENASFADGSFTSNYSSGILQAGDPNGDGGRYRFIDDGANDSRYRYIGDGEFTSEPKRYTGLQAALYANGESVGMTRSASSLAGAETRGGAAYFGKDLLGSVRSATNEYGSVEDRYE